MAEGGRVAILYLRQEDRRIGLGNKIREYELQDLGADTVEANHQLGFPADAREYDLAIELLRQLDLRKIRLMTNNPRSPTAASISISAAAARRKACRSAARRVGKEWVSTFRSRWSPYH